MPNSTRSPRGSKAFPALIVPDVAGMTNKDAAHAYLDAEFWPIPWMPAKPNGKWLKKPCYERGWTYETVDRETHESIARWQSNWQCGLVTSPRSGLLVADVDEPELFESWDIEVPDTVYADSGTEGHYHIFCDGRKLREWPKQGNIPGGQVKTNGFVGAEPSVFRGRQYTFRDGLRRVTPAGRFGVAMTEYRNTPIQHEDGTPAGTSELWQAIADAPNHSQRSTIFDWSRDAHDRGVSDEEILNNLEWARDKGHLRTYDKRWPWNRSELKSAAIPTSGWRHVPNPRMSEDDLDFDSVPESGKFLYLDMSTIGMPEPAKLSPGETSLATNINYIFGSAGDGKTRLVYWDILQRIRNGEIWAIYDREMGPERFREAMTQLGATEDEICSIRYIYPDRTPNLLKDGVQLVKQLKSDGVDGILYDSLAVFLGAAGIQENDQTGVRNWFDKSCRPMNVSWVIDHTGHENADHGRGASAKQDAVDFGIHLTTKTPFSEGCDGEIELTAVKVRRGKFQKQSHISIDVKTNKGKDGMFYMDFQPNMWESPKQRSEMSVSEIIQDILQVGEADDVSATDLQANMFGRKQTKLKRIRDEVISGSIIENRISERNIRYSIAGKVRIR